jgi:hypothetical protein
MDALPMPVALFAIPDKVQELFLRLGRFNHAAEPAKAKQRQYVKRKGEGQ